MSFFFKMNLISVLKKNDIYPLFGELLKGDNHMFLIFHQKTLKL